VVNPEKVVLSGPGNCLLEHGEGGSRGFKAERKVMVRKDVVSGKQECEVAYHMT
jgi:hypothetical protein